MASIATLMQMSVNAYAGTSSTTLNTSAMLAGISPGSGWTVFANSNTQPGTNYWSQGYFGVAYYNSNTGEVVIANRGTVPTNPHNLVSDLGLGLSIPTTVQADAAAFSQWVTGQIQSAYSKGKIPEPISDLIETGHSLGGSEAQAAVR